MIDEPGAQSVEEMRRAGFQAFLDNHGDVAEKLYREAIAQSLSSGQNDIHLVQCFHTLARICMTSGRFDEAEQPLLSGIGLCERFQPAEAFMMSLLSSQLGELYCCQRKWDQAEPWLVRSIELSEQSMGANNRCLDYPLACYAALLRGIGDEEKAEEVEARRAEIERRYGGGEI